MKEELQKKENKMICDNCGCDEFRAYTEVVPDDIDLYCAKCGEELFK